MSFERSCLLLIVGALAGCAATSPSPAPAKESQEVVLLGELDRDRLEREVPGWAEAVARAEVDGEAALALGSVAPGARVRVVLGTWCSDSQREVPRLWRALDENLGVVPFELEYYGVDRATLRSETPVAGIDVEYVPTLVVERDGEEVGRIVESAPRGVEQELLALLTGESRGVISGRPELRAGGESPQS